MNRVARIFFFFSFSLALLGYCICFVVSTLPAVAFYHWVFANFPMVFDAPVNGYVLVITSLVVSLFSLSCCTFYLLFSIPVATRLIF